MFQTNTQSKVMSARWTLLARQFALAGIIGPIFFVLVFTIDGFMRPNYSPIQQTVSTLGRGQNAWILNSSLVVLGLLLLLFVAGLSQGMNQIRKRKPLVSSSLLLITGLGGILDGVFTQADPNHPGAIAGIVHNFAFLIGFITLSIAQLVIGQQLSRFREWRQYSRYSRITGTITLFLFLLYFFLPLLRLPIIGLAQRVLIIEAFAWYVVTGALFFKAKEDLKMEKRLATS